MINSSSFYSKKKKKRNTIKILLPKKKMHVENLVLRNVSSWRKAIYFNGQRIFMWLRSLDLRQLASFALHNII